MNITQALQLVFNAINTANLKGVYSLEDSVNIFNCLQAIKQELNNKPSSEDNIDKTEE